MKIDHNACTLGKMCSLKCLSSKFYLPLCPRGSMSFKSTWVAWNYWDDWNHQIIRNLIVIKKQHLLFVSKPDMEKKNVFDVRIKKTQKTTKNGQFFLYRISFGHFSFCGLKKKGLRVHDANSLFWLKPKLKVLCCFVLQSKWNQVVCLLFCSQTTNEKTTSKKECEASKQNKKSPLNTFTVILYTC